MKPKVIGVSGRSGSGKTTLVKNILSDFGPDIISLHTMDNYYLPRNEQFVDKHKYLNFDLPTAFYRNEFFQDLEKLKNYKQVILNEYQFNSSKELGIIKINPAPIILVEGLFIFYFEEIFELMDHRVMVDLNFDEAFARRMKRDQIQRNYTVEEINYRYLNHVEPSYQKFILPYKDKMNMIITNEKDLRIESAMLYSYIEELLQKKE